MLFSGGLGVDITYGILTDISSEYFGNSIGSSQKYPMIALCRYGYFIYYGNTRVSENRTYFVHNTSAVYVPSTYNFNQINFTDTGANSQFLRNGEILGGGLTNGTAVVNSGNLVVGCA